MAESLTPLFRDTPQTCWRPGQNGPPRSIFLLLRNHCTGFLHTLATPHGDAATTLVTAPSAHTLCSFSSLHVHADTGSCGQVCGCAGTTRSLQAPRPHALDAESWEQRPAHRLRLRKGQCYDKPQFAFLNSLHSLNRQDAWTSQRFQDPCVVAAGRKLKRPAVTR